MPADDPPPPAPARLLRRRRGLVTLGASAALGGAIGVVAQFAVDFSPLQLVTAFVAYAAGLLLVARALQDPRLFARDPRPLELGEGELRAGGRRLIARGEIDQAFVVARPGAAMVQLRARGGGQRSLPLTVEVGSEADGHALLRALGLDASRSIATYQLASRLLLARGQRAPVLAAVVAAWIAVYAIILFSNFGGPWMAALGVALAVMLGGALPLLWPTRIHVGADAVVIHWMGTRRRIRLGEIDHVVRTPGTLRILLRSDEVIELSYPGKAPSEEELARLAANGITTGAAELGRAAARIEEALAAHRTERGEPPELALERGSQGAAEWLRRLRSMGRATRPEHADYRRQVLAPERLWRIVEDPALPPGARAGAAIALSEALDDAGKKRLRVAAEASALPGIRALLESVAAEAKTDEAALCEMLDAVDEEEPRAHRAREP
jgi:hypothetical protein